MAEVYDVFISYRRDGGFETAKHLNDLLVRDGYSVSFDIDTLREGDFDKALLKRIEQCRDFLVIVDKHAFDKMVNPAPDYDPKKDWFREEVSYALQLKKNIISVLLAGASFPSRMPESLEGLETKNGPKYSIEYFDSFYEKLKTFIQSTPRNQNNNTVLDVKNQAYLKIISDLDCIFYIDGEEQTALKAGIIGKFSLFEGGYMLKFIGSENEEDCLEMTFNMPSKDTVLKIDLAEKRASRLQTQSYRVNGVSFIMKPVEGGLFQMGNEESDADDSEKPLHDVVLSSYYIGETEVTQALWKAVMGKNPSCFKGDNLPVECVSYYDIVETFLPRLNQLTGKVFRLPTEAEWEYAARGGKQSHGFKYSGSNNLDDVAWYWRNSGKNYLNCSDDDWNIEIIDKNKCSTRPVKGKFPNELGLYDMSGNVWEWCSDIWYQYNSSSEKNPRHDGGYDCPRVLRGGSWGIDSVGCRVSRRLYYTPDYSGNCYGFRLCLS